MKTCTRRLIIQSGSLGFMSVCAGAQGAALATGMAAATRRKPSLGWKEFVASIRILAQSYNDGPQWDQERYVASAADLAKRLRTNDSTLERARREYWDEHRGRPEFFSLEKVIAFQIDLISFESGDAIPLHNHPEMTGLTVCLSGQLAVHNYEIARFFGRYNRVCELKGVSSQVMGTGNSSTLTANRGNVHTLRASAFTQVIEHLHSAL